jgi:V8-like Glu-specific endopeptidase
MFRTTMPLLTSFFLLAGAVLPAAEPHTQSVYERTLRSTAWVIVPVTDTTTSFGTGWIVNQQKRLLITNHHVVADKQGKPAKTVSVIFPAYRNGKLVAEKSYYLKNGPRIHGKIVRTDPRRDLALIELEALPGGVQELKAASASPAPSTKLHLVGNPGASDALWVYGTGSVRQVYRAKYQMSNEQELEARIIESDVPTNVGDSGSPVVNDRGELVGVHSNGDDKSQLLSGHIDITEVRGFLAALNLKLATAYQVSPGTAEEHEARGIQFGSKQEYEPALAELNESIRLNANRATPYTNRAAVLLALGDYESALADCDKALALDPKQVLAQVNRGCVYHQMGQYPQALEAFNKALAMQPHNARTLFRRGLTLERLGRSAEARRDLEEAYRLDPSLKQS